MASTSQFGYFTQPGGPSPVNVMNNLFSGFHNPVDERVRSQVVAVYTLLAGGLASATLGSMFTMYTGGVGGTLGLFGAIGFLLALAFTPADSGKSNTRVQLFHGFTVCKGMSLGPLLMAVAHVDPAIILMALGGTAVIFGCFTAAALYAQRRSYLFLGGMLSSALSLMMWVSIINMFVGSALASSFQVYAGLLVFSAYVLFDTQVIIEAAHAGPLDTVSAALNLFIDFVAIFVRLLIILSRNSDKKKRSNDRR